MSKYGVPVGLDSKFNIDLAQVSRLPGKIRLESWKAVNDQEIVLDPTGDNFSMRVIIVSCNAGQCVLKAAFPMTLGRVEVASWLIKSRETEQDRGSKQHIFREAILFSASFKGVPS